jgi:hypothetical protein
MERDVHSRPSQRSGHDIELHDDGGVVNGGDTTPQTSRLQSRRQQRQALKGADQTVFGLADRNRRDGRRT